MILINLLPHREIAKVKRRESFYVSLAASALLGGLLAGLIYVWYQIEITEQQGRNIVLSSEIASLNAQIKEVASLEQEIADLRARQGAVEDLQAERNLPVHLLNELVKRVPDGVYLKGMKQVNSLVTLTGSAQSNERVAELLRNLSNNSPFVTKPELVEIIAGSASLGAKDQRRVSNFIVSVQLKKLTKDKESDTSSRTGTTSPASGTTTVNSSPLKK